MSALVLRILHALNDFFGFLPEKLDVEDPFLDADDPWLDR